jgi:putative oxidoreductase
MKKLVSTNIAIVVFALIIGFFGANQILNADSMVANAPKFVPAAKIFVYISGIGLLLAAVAFIIDRFAKPAGYLVALLLLIIVFTVHLPGIINAESPKVKMLFFTNALKDTAMAMGAIVIGNLSKH